MEALSYPPHQSQTRCTHCHREIDPSRSSPFCCVGCETVYRLNAVEVNAAEIAPVRLYIEGINCSSCVWVLERLPTAHPSLVREATVNLQQSVLTLRLAPGAQMGTVLKIISELGYTPHALADERESEKKSANESRKRLVDLGIAGALAGNVMLMSVPLYSGVVGPFRTLFEWISLALAMPSVFYSGRSFFANVWAGIRSRTFPIDGPILLAILVAFFYSTVSLIQGTHELYFDSLTTLVFLLLASRYYLSRLRKSSQMSLGVLEYFQGEIKRLKGERVSLKSGERLDFDGVVRAGQVWLDLAHFSGESVPVLVRAGGMTFAGTQVIEASPDAVAEVEKVGDQTRMAHLLENVRAAQEKRSPVQLQSDRWARVLLQLVMGIAVASLAYFIERGQSQEGVKRVLALLIVTCPCALALATPLVFSLAIKKLLRRGLLVKDPIALDRAVEIQNIYFDKTGTLTWGKLKVIEELSVLNPEWMQIVYSLCTQSRHPVSRAIEQALIQARPQLTCLDWADFEEKPGIGLFARSSSGTEYQLVRPSENTTQSTQVAFIKDGIECARFTLQDQVREKTREVIQNLKSQHYTLALVSGDHWGPVQEVSARTGIERQFAQQTPEQKASIVQDGLMVGDGLNDALALSEARVSIAVQGGIDAAVQSSQVFSMKPGIELVPEFLQMSRLVRRTLKQNFAFSTTYNVVGVVLSLSGFMNPLIAAILMPLSASTVFVATLIRLRGGAHERT